MIVGRLLKSVAAATLATAGLGLVAVAPASANVIPWRGMSGVSVECERGDYGCTTGGYGGSEPWGYYTRFGSRDGAGRLHNCTTYVAFKAAQAGFPKPVWSANANGWDDNARARGLPVNGSPAVGAIAQWNSGSAGHVAYVEVSDSQGIVITDDSFGKNVTRRVRVNFGSPAWPDNFIHMSSNTPAEFYGDWDGNGTVTPGVVRRVNGELQWHLRNTNGPGPADIIFSYGSASDMPVVGNWDGVGGDTIGITRRVNGVLEWHLRNYNSAGPANMIFGYGNDTTDMPIAGNWDGVGGDTIGIARRNPNGVLEWHLRNYNSAGPAQSVFGYGSSSIDTPIVGDWDGVGGDTVGVVRVADQAILQWHLRNYISAGPAQAVFGYGGTSETQWI